MRHPSAVGRRFREPVCPRGHDKRIVGVRKNNFCLECHRASNRRYWREVRPRHYFVKPFCSRGHDKRVIGVDLQGKCLICLQIWRERYSNKLARGNPRSLRRAQRIPNLKALRNELGITVQELSEASGVSHSAIYRLQNEVRARPKTLAAILKVIAPLLRERKYEEAGL